MGILAALVVTGCDQVGAAEEPTDAVQRLVETIADKDFEQASEYLCEARRGEFEQAIEGSSPKLGNFVRQAAEASGEEVSDEQLDSLVQMLVQAGEQAQPIDSEVELVRENDEWLVYDDLDFLNQTGVFQLP